MSITVRILTREQEIIEQDVDMVTASTEMGQTGILPNHSTLLSMLKPGLLKLKKGERNSFYKLGRGYLQVDNNIVEIFTDIAERAPASLKTH